MLTGAPEHSHVKEQSLLKGRHPHLRLGSAVTKKTAGFYTILINLSCIIRDINDKRMVIEYEMIRYRTLQVSRP
jgi:hypothetical protein